MFQLRFSIKVPLSSLRRQVLRNSLGFILSLCYFSVAQAVLRAPVSSVCPKTPAGYWLTYDTHDGVTPNGIMHMYIQRGVLSGALIKVINKPGDKTIARCTKCSGSDHNRILDGMTLITGMKYKGGMYQSGYIFDPRTATTYKGRIKLLRRPCHLQVRGYVGFSLLGKTVYWTPLTKQQAKEIIRKQVG